MMPHKTRFKKGKGHTRAIEASERRYIPAVVLRKNPSSSSGSIESPQRRGQTRKPLAEHQGQKIGKRPASENQYRQNAAAGSPAGEAPGHNELRCSAARSPGKIAPAATFFRPSAEMPSRALPRPRVYYTRLAYDHVVADFLRDLESDSAGPSIFIIFMRGL